MSCEEKLGATHLQCSVSSPQFLPAPLSRHSWLTSHLQNNSYKAMKAVRLSSTASIVFTVPPSGFAPLCNLM